MNPLQKILDRLPDAKGSGRTYAARCPAHDDRKPSLSIQEGNDGTVRVKCHAGCSPKLVLAELGLTLADLFVSALTLQSPPQGQPTKQMRYPTADAAVVRWERRLGKHTAHWDYHDAEGRHVGRIIRWDTPGGKEVRPVSLFDGGWALKGMGTPRPLYNLPALVADLNAWVYVTEGEKCADALISMGLLATTSAHGSASASSGDWSLLAGREVVIVPDNDAAGEVYADTVTAILHRLAPPAVVRVVRLEGLGSGEDVADLMDRNRERVRGLGVAR
jgi:hypothetical protein